MIGFLCAAVMWLFAQYLPGPIVKHSALTSLALIIAGLGVIIEGLSVSSFVRAKTTVNPLQPQRANKLVISGMNRFSRNPMYLGMLLLLTAWAIFLGYPVGVMPVVGFVNYITTFQIKPEEAALENVFGDEYLAYKSKVRRWI